MDQEYQITGYDIAGPPEETPYGTTQGFWLKIPGVEEGVIWNKQVKGGPPQVGPVWGRLERKESKKGKPYYKFVKGKGPGHTTVARVSRPEAAQPALPLSTGREVITWGEAVLAAAMMVGPGAVYDEVLDRARFLYQSLPDGAEDKLEGDLPPVEVYSEQIGEELDPEGVL